MNKFLKLRPSDDFEKETQIIENNPILCLDQELKITYKKEGWKQRYYNYCLDVDTSFEIDKISQEYIEGIYWTFKTILKNVNVGNGDDYNYAPTLYHLKKYLEKNNYDIVFKKKKPLMPYTQLFIILPAESYCLLPKKYHSYILEKDSCLSYLYPKEYKFSKCFKRYDWQCTPVLPCIDNNTVDFIKNI